MSSLSQLGYLACFFSICSPVATLSTFSGNDVTSGPMTSSLSYSSTVVNDHGRRHASIELRPASPLTLAIGQSQHPVCLVVVVVLASNDTGREIWSSPVGSASMDSFVDDYNVTVNMTSGAHVMTSTSVVRHRMPYNIQEALMDIGGKEPPPGFDDIYWTDVDSFCFELEAINVGKAVLTIQLFSGTSPTNRSTFWLPVSLSGASENSAAEYNDRNRIDANGFFLVADLPYYVAAYRRQRVTDIVFLWVVAITTLLNNFGLGCSTSLDDVTRQLRTEHTTVIVAAISQLVVLPSTALLLIYAFSIDRVLGIGLFYVACFPAGGLGFVISSMTSPDGRHTPGSVTINMFAVYAQLITVPMWIATFDYYYVNKRLETEENQWPTLESHFKLFSNSVPPLVAFELVLIVNALTHAGGLLVRHYFPVFSENFLAWFTRPFLLLFALGFSTLGVYINIYSFDVRPVNELLVVAFSLPASGYISAILMSFAGRLPVAARTHVSIESSVVNCLLASIAFRLGVGCDIDADVYCAAAMLVVCATPAFLVCASISRRFLRCISQRIKPMSPDHKPEVDCNGKRKCSHVASDDSNGGIESTFTNVRCSRCGKGIPEATAVASASLLPKSRSQTTQAEELEISVIVVDEKVTVL